MSYESIRPGAWMAALVLLTLAAVFGATAWAYLRRPAWAGLPRAEPTPRAHAVMYAAIFAAVLAVGVYKVVPAWWMQNDEERDAMLSALCGRGLGCPVVGNEMNRLRIPLGPLNRYLMTLCWLVSPDPRVALGAVLALHAAAAAWAARTVDSLVGAPAGVVAAALLGTHAVLLEVCVQPSNGSWVLVFLVGALWATLRWVRGDGAVPFVAAVAFFGCAVQLHGTSFAMLPGVLLAALIWRPRTPRRALYAAGIVTLVLASPWLRFQLDTGLSVLRVVSVGWLGQGGGGGGPSPSGPMQLRDALKPLQELGALAGALSLLGVAALARPEPDASLRAGRRALLVVLGATLSLLLLGGVLARGNWANRYAVPYLPAMALTAGAAWGLWGRRARWVAWALAAVASVAAARWNFGTASEVLNATAHGRYDLMLAENIEAVRALSARGYRPQDIESRVHGYAWNRWNGSQIYLAHWIMGPRRGEAPRAHVLVTACPTPPGFARWTRRLTTSHTAGRALVGYEAALSPARLEFDFGGAPWSYTPGLPFYFQQAYPSDGRIRARLDPALGFPRPYEALPTLWNSSSPASRRARVTTTLAPGPDDRALTLLAPDDASPVVTVRGVTLAPAGHDRVPQEGRWWYVVPAAMRASDAAPVVVTLDLSQQSMFPWRIDLYEDPTPECAR